MRIANVLTRVVRFSKGPILWFLVRLKVGLQSIVPKRQADVFLGCMNDWRYPPYLLRALRSLGDMTFEVPVRSTLFFLQNSSLKDFIRRVIIIPDDAVPRATTIISRDPDSVHSTARSRVRVSVDYFSKDQRDRGIVMPYFIHPHLWRFEREFASLSKGPRPVRIGFAGTINTKAYSQGFRFPMMSRTEIFDTICSRFGHCTEFVRHRDEYERKRAKQPAILIVAVDATADTIRKHILHGRKYLRFLGSCTFVVAPPGWAMPFSHNLVEAMFLGAIPILNYADYLVPPLRDGIDCLAFSTPEELSQIIERALTMGAAEIERLRSDVDRYAADHLSVKAFARRLYERMEMNPTIVVNDGI